MIRGLVEIEEPDTLGHMERILFFHFHTTLGSFPYTKISHTPGMVTATDMKRLIDRWGRIANRLPNNDLKYGIELVRLLEKRKGPELAYFDDPLEAVIVFFTIEMLRGQKRERAGFDP